MRTLLTCIAVLAFMASATAQEVTTEKKARKVSKTEAVTAAPDEAPKPACCASKAKASGASCASKAEGRAEAAAAVAPVDGSPEAAAAPKAGCADKAEAHAVDHEHEREEAPAAQPN
jgi:hypothetical protein